MVILRLKIIKYIEVIIGIRKGVTTIPRGSRGGDQRHSEGSSAIKLIVKDSLIALVKTNSVKVLRKQG